MFRDVKSARRFNFNLYRWKIPMFGTFSVWYKNKQNIANKCIKVQEGNFWKLIIQSSKLRGGLIFEKFRRNLHWKVLQLDHLYLIRVLYCVLCSIHRDSERYDRRKREIVRVKASRRAALNDTNGVRARSVRRGMGSWTFSISFSFQHRVSSFMDFFYRCVCVCVGTRARARVCAGGP